MIKKNNLLVLYFLQFNLTSLRGKEYFGSFVPEPLKKKTGAGAGAAWEKNLEPEPLKNLPAPQPCS